MQRAGTAHLHVIAVWATQLLSKKCQRRAVGNSVSDFTSPRFEFRTSRSRDERVTAQPAKERILVDLSQRPIKSRALLELLSCVLIS